MVNGVLEDDGIIYLSLRTCSGIIGIEKSTKELVFELKYPLVAQQHCPVITDKGNLFEKSRICSKAYFCREQIIIKSKFSLISSMLV